MKTLMTIILIAIMFSIAGAVDLGFLAVNDTALFPIICLDTLGREVQSDSNHVMVWYGAVGANTYTYAQRDATGGANPAWIDSVNINGGTNYYFMDVVGDLDGTKTNGLYAGVVRTWWRGYATSNPFTFSKIGDASSYDNLTDQFGTLQTINVLSTDTVNVLSTDTVQVVSTDTVNVLSADTVNVISTDTISVVDSVIIDGSALAATAGAITTTTLPRLAYFDTLIYQGPRSLGIYIDSAAGNTNTVIGTDGTSKNPVSTIAAAKTLATALGYNRYYFLNASTFNDAANDLASSHQNWEFIGIGNSNALAFGTQRIDESRFENMDLSGTMHASGGDVLYTNCTFGYITANFNGHAFNCWLEDTIVVKADQDIDFARCQSGVAGNRTPTIDLSGGSSVVQLRGYSGGIRIMNGASTDTISVETDGQVIIASNNTSLNITVRGMATLTDNGTTTNLTKDAVFSRAEADLWVWANADTAQPDSSDLGVWLVNNLSGAGSSNWSDAQRDSVLANMEDGAITATKIATNAIGATEIAANAIGESEIAPNAIGSSEIAARALTLAKFDSAFIALLTEGIWLWDGAANTNSTVGIDGTISNPVSTLAAARILADSQGIQKYYLRNNSTFTLDATYEDWIFMGIGEGSLIDFGSQDVDGSEFIHLMISGTQGGTGVVGLHGCYLNTIDSLEAVVANSSYSDTISLRVSTNTVFDQCYSHIAGNASPGLDFNSAGGITVEVRHYSGGLTLFNGTSTDTISYESDGQLVIDVSCTSLNVTARGNMTITDNGTTTSLTDFAVFNVNAVAAYPEYTYKMVATGSPTTTTIAVSYIVDNEGNSPGTEANDFCLGMQFQPKGGNSNSKMVTIADFTIADSTFTVRPGFASAPNSGDTIFIRPGRGAVEPSTWTQHELAITGGGQAGIDLDNTLGDFESADFEDSALTGIKFHTDYYDTVTQIISDNAGTVSLPDSVVARIDSILASTGDSLEAHVGRDGLSTTTVSLHMKVGSYSGAAGDNNNIKDDIAAIGAGAGNQPETVYVYDTNNTVTVPNIPIQARNSSGTNLGQVTTNSEGYGVLNQDDASTIYIRISQTTGYVQTTNPETVSVASPYKDTVYVTAFSPTAPAGDLTTLYNWVVDGNDQGIKNVEIEAYIPNKFWPVKNTNKAIRARHSTKTDSVGYWELQIFGNDIVLTAQGDSSSYWMVTTEDETFKHKVTVSSDSSSQLMIPDAD